MTEMFPSIMHDIKSVSHEMACDWIISLRTIQMIWRYKSDWIQQFRTVIRDLHRYSCNYLADSRSQVHILGRLWQNNRIELHSVLGMRQRIALSVLNIYLPHLTSPEHHRRLFAG